MSEELKPCPFCGGEAAIRREDDMWIVECRHHGWSSKDDDGCSYAGDISLYVEISGKVNHWTHEIEYAEKDIDLAKKKAIEAWNRRAERTCVFRYEEKLGEYACSSCGERVSGSNPADEYEVSPLAVLESFEYCPNCGARVIKEES